MDEWTAGEQDRGGDADRTAGEVGVTDLVDLLLRLSRLLHGSFGRLLREQHEFSLSEALVLQVLSRKGALRLTDLSRIVGLPASTLTGLVDRLDQRGFIQRHRDEADRRSVLVEATPQLKAWVAGRKMAVERAIAPRLATLPPHVIPRLIDDLGSLTQVLATSEEEGGASGAGN